MSVFQVSRRGLVVWPVRLVACDLILKTHQKHFPISSQFSSLPSPSVEGGHSLTTLVLGAGPFPLAILSFHDWRMTTWLWPQTHWGLCETPAPHTHTQVHTDKYTDTPPYCAPQLHVRQCAVSVGQAIFIHSNLFMSVICQELRLPIAMIWSQTAVSEETVWQNIT